MPKVVNKNPNASTNVNGVEFKQVNGFMVSVDNVDGENLEIFRQVPGFEILEDRPPLEKSDLTDAEGDAANADEPAKADAQEVAQEVANTEAVEPPQEESKPKAAARKK